MEYQKQNGPKIKAKFTINNGKISAIDLSKSKVTLWEIIGESNASLEKDICCWMNDYCTQKPCSIDLPLSTEHNLPLFTKIVLDRLKAIPFGKFMSYQDLAEILQNPKGARAVGGACGRNPFPLVIPCHRILAKAQKLGGFSCGISIKEQLLIHEGIDFQKS